MPILTSLTLSKLGLVVLRVALGGLKWVTLSLTMNLYIKVVLCMHILFYFVCVCVLFFFLGGWGGLCARSSTYSFWSCITSVQYIILTGLQTTNISLSVIWTCQLAYCM